jgi:hypothetical protein
MPPVITTRPQTMGSGSTTRYITVAHGFNTGYSNYDIGAAMFASNEYTEIAINYQYVKILSLKVICRAVNYVNSTNNLYFKINWNNNDETGTTVQQSDNSKFVSPVSTRARVFTFYPPNVQVSPTDHENPTVFQNSLLNQYTLKCHVQNTIDSNFRLIFEVCCLFKTSRDWPESAKGKLNEIKNILIGQDKQEEVEEEEEEQDKVFKEEEKIIKKKKKPQ